MTFKDSLLHGMTIRESATDGSDFTSPAADYRRLFLGEDGLLHLKDSAGAVTDVGAGGSGLGAWTTYTPTWTTTGAAPSLGNGTLTGRYKALDANTYAISISLVLGTTTTVGGGQFAFALPAGVTSAARIQTMSAAILDSGTDYFSCTAWVAASDTKILHIVVGDTTSVKRAEAGKPMTWATGDSLIINGMIEVA